MNSELGIDYFDSGKDGTLRHQTAAPNRACQLLDGHVAQINDVDDQLLLAFVAPP